MAIEIIVLLLIHIVGSSVSSEENVKKEFTWDDLLRIVKSGISSAVKMAMPSMFRALSTANMSSNCERGLMLYLTAIRKLDSWAVKMVDASSKIPSGILEGTLMDFGSFDECLHIRAKRNSKNEELLRGRYCTLSVRSSLMSAPWEKTSDGKNYTDVYGHPPKWVKEVMVKAGPYINLYTTFWMGICVPSLCTQHDMQSIATAISKPYGLNTSVSDCQVDEPYVWKPVSLAAVCALGCLAVLCGIGTLMDVIGRWRKRSSESKHEDLVISRAAKAFSVLTNTEKLFSATGRSGCLHCFNGIRFLSATWIVMGHTYFLPELRRMYTEYRELGRTTDYFNGSLPITVIENFTLAVSTFFFMSGFLLVYTTWEHLKKSDGRINLFMFFIHKYWRMAPGLLLLMTLLFSMPVIDSGPLWNSMLEPWIEKCQNLGWKNLLFIQNLSQPNRGLQCLAHTWYLSALMQLHIVGILLLVLTYRWPVAGVLVSSLATVTCVTFVAVSAVFLNYPMPVPSYMDDYDLNEDFLLRVYISPFLHFPTYLVGMVAAFFVLKYRYKKLTVKCKALGWILAIVIALLAVYGVHLNADHVAAKAIYHSTARIGFASGLAWMTYACASGFGGIVNRILSCSVMRPLGEISFLTYLIHYLVIFYKVASARERVYNGHSVLVFSAFSTMLVSFGLAYVGYVTVEMPFAALEKIIFRCPKSKLDIAKNAVKGQTTVTPNGKVTSL